MKPIVNANKCPLSSLFVLPNFSLMRSLITGATPPRGPLGRLLLDTSPFNNNGMRIPRASLYTNSVNGIGKEVLLLEWFPWLITKSCTVLIFEFQLESNILVKLNTTKNTKF